jgi:hypothetical protein
MLSVDSDKQYRMKLLEKYNKNTLALEVAY